jgi:hypothetical protein
MCQVHGVILRISWQWRNGNLHSFYSLFNKTSLKGDCMKKYQCLWLNLPFLIYHQEVVIYNSRPWVQLLWLAFFSGSQSTLWQMEQGLNKIWPLFLSRNAWNRALVPNLIMEVKRISNTLSFPPYLVSLSCTTRLPVLVVCVMHDVFAIITSEADMSIITTLGWKRMLTVLTWKQTEVILCCMIHCVPLSSVTGSTGSYISWVSHECILVINFFISCTDMRRLKTGIRSEICVVIRFRHCANVYLHKPR